MSTLIPVERLWKLYDYNPLTGQLISRRLGRPLKASPDHAGYKIVRIIHDGKAIHCKHARIVYAWCTGAWPIQELDHEDRNRANDRFHNLRPTTRRKNIHNSSRFKGGCAYDKGTGRYLARIQIQGKRKYLGAFATQAEAQQAYKDALKALEAP